MVNVAAIALTVSTTPNTMVERDLSVVERAFDRLEKWSIENDSWLSKWYIDYPINLPVVVVLSLWSRAFVYCRWLFSGLDFEIELLYDE